MSEYRYKLSSRAKQVLKKIKDKALLRRYQATMRDICERPFEGDPKVGDLDGLFTVGFRYVDGEHRVAYTVVEDGDTEPFVLILLVGTRENFYEELKRIWKGL
ncbi:plasmid stabilization protein [Kyrpidia spormannii]|uniref:Plasmid stabilization protein n=1 Tax=Kyrpidia spormannii TaxID=2055160 RepID=A0A2K8N5A9_9BACL|nr:type II toxin-antitoxin system RelE/ParE family toxin [Kyrpidia spormannii]ATY84503.1 plasmid stabilization protein [Kyrpidia spormannii]